MADRNRKSSPDGHTADELLKVFILHHHLRQASVACSISGKFCAHIMGLAAETVEAAGIGIADELIEPRRFLHVRCGTVAGEGTSNQIEVLTRIEGILQRRHQFPRFIPNASVQLTSRLLKSLYTSKSLPEAGEHDPSASTEYLDIPLVEQREHGQDGIPQSFFSSDPRHEAVQRSSPPSSGSRVWAGSKRSSDFSSP